MDIGFVGKNGPKIESRDEKKLRDSAEEFESMFIKMMMDSMEKTLDRKGSINFGGRGEEIFRDMLSVEMSKKMVKSHPLGLADQLYNQMSGKLKGKE